MNAVHLVARL